MNEDAADALSLAMAAWAAWTDGDPASAQRLAADAWAGAQRRTRRDRQLVQVVCLAVGGYMERARGLASEHLSEFPDDDVARAVQTRSRRDD